MDTTTNMVDSSARQGKYVHMDFNSDNQRKTSNPEFHQNNHGRGQSMQKLTKIEAQEKHKTQRCSSSA
jgi:hypothetical protein